MQISTTSVRLTDLNLLAGNETSRFGRLLRSKPGAEHRLAFRDWLLLRLEQQLADLEEFLSPLNHEQQMHMERWLARGNYSELIPMDAPLPDRLLFQMDLETLVTLMRIC
jgi:hypothetical protein